MTDTFNLPDIPDLSGVAEDTKPEPFADGWYGGTILEKREFTDQNGNERVFESVDDVAQKSGRNIRLQIALKRASDGRTLNTSALINYQPEDLSAETVKAVMTQKDKVKEGEQWGTMFRPFMTLQRLGKLQRIAGVKALSRNGNGGLDLHPLYNKRAYFKIAPDNRNPQYKQIVDFREDAPKNLL